MLFQNDTASLDIQIKSYEFPADGGDPDSDDRNWLVLRGTYREEETVIKDSVSCLLTYELKEMTAGLKVLAAGIREEYISTFSEPYFALAALADGQDFRFSVSFALPNTMEDLDIADVRCRMDSAGMKKLIGELDDLCTKFPDRI